jgi:hypothetical protein
MPVRVRYVRDRQAGEVDRVDWSDLKPRRHRRPGAFVKHRRGGQDIPGGAAWLGEQAVRRRGPEGEAEQDHPADDHGGDDQHRTADPTPKERARHANRPGIGEPDHPQPEDPVTGRAAVTPLENAPDEPPDDKRRDQQEGGQGQRADAPAQARCGLLADHKENRTGLGAPSPGDPPRRRREDP